jgi:hypothetical protein
VEVERLISAQGPIIALSASGDRVLAVAIERGELVAYSASLAGQAGAADRTDLGAVPALQGVIALIDAEMVVIAWPEAAGVSAVPTATGAAVVRVHHLTSGRVIEETTTEIAFGAPSLALGGGVLHRVARGTVVSVRFERNAAIERPALGVVAEQTTLHAAPEGVIAVEQVLGRTRYRRVFRGETIDLDVDPLDMTERLLAQTVACDGGTTLVVRLTRQGGRDQVRTNVLDARGIVSALACTPVDRRTSEDAILGGLFHAGAYLVATDAGLVREGLSAKSPTMTFAATARLVAKEDRLALTRRGLAIAHESTVSLVRLTTEASTGEPR